MIENKQLSTKREVWFDIFTEHLDNKGIIDEEQKDAVKKYLNGKYSQG